MRREYTKEELKKYEGLLKIVERLSIISTLFYETGKETQLFNEFIMELYYGNVNNSLLWELVEAEKFYISKTLEKMNEEDIK
jgi:hypothetical protein